MKETENTVEQESIEKQPNVIDLNQFLNEFGAGLMDSVSKQHPPVYDGVPNAHWDQIMSDLKRRPFDARFCLQKAIAEHW
jgi:hypothetical protein